MKFSDIKYFMSLSIPIVTYYSIQYEGWVSWATLIYAFGFIPIVEQILPVNQNNDIQTTDDEREESLFFDILLFANLPIMFFLIYFCLEKISNPSIGISDISGKLISLGIFLGACGINVAHELGHKNHWLSQWTAKLLLTPCLYNHFTLQHNRGHHLNVGTPNDPATSNKNEPVYTFWLRSVIGTYNQAWQLELSRLKRLNISFWSLKNEMFINSALTIFYIIVIIFFYGFSAILLLAAAGIFSVLLLETINYIEHYGLQRKLLDNGRYEMVDMLHSWNSNHQLGRIVLYELTRHADHHYKANKKYQMLLHYDKSPQLPLGYPGSMLLSLLPFIWFKKMNPIVDNFNAQRA
jgi:alkane 1-monooxygenase